MQYIIYKHTCSISKKSYIGLTKNLSQRTRDHKSLSLQCPVFHKAIKKYGWENFTTEILDCAEAIDEANVLEEKYIAHHNTMVPNGYNLKSGGKYNLHSEETKQKISEAHKGMKLSKATKQKMSNSHRGVKRTPHSEQTKRKISEAHKGVRRGPHSEESKRKISEAKFGKHRSEETKRKISETLRGVKRTPHSEETKYKISVAALKRAQRKREGEII